MPYTLVIGRSDDPHSLAVTNELKKLGQQVEVLDVFKGDSIHLNISQKTAFGIALEISGLLGDKISSVWFRQKPIIASPWWSPLQHDAARFAQSEWRIVLQSLEQFLPNVFWVNLPSNQQRINYKPVQLDLAKKVGFNIPETLISNDPVAITNFVAKHERVIYKGLSGFVFSDQTAILTNVITLEDLKIKESLRKAPGIYQDFIPKKFEARVTVVGDRLFVTRIRTPQDGAGSIDWRNSHFEDIFEQGDIPLDIASNIKQFQTNAGLHYGAYDFIITEEDKWFFLECNPAGQYLWMERCLGQNISLSIAEDLIYCRRVAK